MTMKLLLAIIAMLWTECASFRLSDLTKPIPICQGATGPITQLKNELFCDYDKSVRPVKNLTDKTVVKLSLILKYIDFNDFENTLQVHMFAVLSWNDTYLMWDHLKNRGLQYMLINSDEIWVPDIIVANSGDFAYQYSLTSTACLLFSPGTVSCLVPRNIAVHCSPDFRHWPFDTQICDLIFTSWSHASNDITLHVDNSVYRKATKENNVWQLLNVSTVMKLDSFENDTYSSLKVTYIVKRNSPQHVALIYIPAFALAIMILLTFWIPSDGPDRFTVCSVDILCNAILLLHLYTSTPGNADNTMFIVLYYRDSFIMATVVLLLTIAEQRLLHKSASPPLWIFTLTNLIVETKVGQLLLLNEITIKGAAEVSAEGEEEGAGLVDMSAPAGTKGWHFAVVLLDRVTFIVYSVTFIILMIQLFP